MMLSLCLATPLTFLYSGCYKRVIIYHSMTKPQTQIAWLQLYFDMVLGWADSWEVIFGVFPIKSCKHYC